MLAGEFSQSQLTADGLHPNDLGHKLIATEITGFLERVMAQMEEMEEELLFPAPMTANSYENARRLTIREASPALSGFRADPREKSGHLDCFKNGWIGQRPGNSIRFEVEASCIAVQYRKTVRRPALAARRFWTAIPSIRYRWTETLTRTGATACTWSRSSTGDSGGSTR